MQHVEDTVGKTIGSMKTSDKIIGLVLLTGVVSVLGYGMYWILPYLVEMAANTIYFVGELVVLAVLAMVFLDKNTWLNLYYGWQNLSRGIRRSIISSDPIGILSTVINRYAQKLEDIDANIVLADGATKRQRNTIAEAEKQRNMELNLAKAAEQQGKTLQIGLHANSAKRWDDSAEEMRPMLTVLENALVSMQRARDLCEVKMEDTKNQKLVLSRRLEALMSGQKAVRKIKSFFGTNPDLEMQEMAVEDIERKSTEALAEIDQFMRVINPKLEASDLKQSADQMAALEKFNTFLTSSGTAPQLPEATTQPVRGIVVSAREITKEKR